MSPEAIKAVFNTRPFVPAKLHTHDGRVVEVRSPHFVTLARSAFIVVRADRDGRPTDDVDYVAYPEVWSIECLAGEPKDGRTS